MVPTSFEVPYEHAWPNTTHGLKLGNVVGCIRNRGDWGSKKEELISLGFEFRSILDVRWDTRILPALMTYREIHGDLLIPAEFVVPSSSPWPECSYNLSLGALANHIRNLGAWEAKHDQLNELGFQVSVFLIHFIHFKITIF